RLLRSADDIEDVVVEVPPTEGTLLAFRRTDNSYHGHLPFLGPRRVIQMNWVTSALTVRRELCRHRLSAWAKRALALLSRRRRAAVLPPAPERRGSTCSPPPSSAGPSSASCSSSSRRSATSSTPSRCWPGCAPATRWPGSTGW